MASIQEPQRKDYARRLEAFYAFAVRYELDVSQEKRLDEALCEFVDHLFLDGEDVNYGQKLQAALEYERPEFSRHGRALKGWRRLAPTQTRLPMLEFLKSAVSGIFLEEGHREEALYNEVTFSCYTRPGETLRIQAADVVPATHEFDKTVMVLGPLERGVSSKVGVYDETVILDDRRAPWLDRLLIQQAQRQLAKLGEDAPLWTFSAASYLTKWRRAVERLGVAEIAKSPYQNRHGGASRDHLLKLRSMAEIQRRGRWASDSSARIYDKPGRLQQAINQFDHQYRSLGEELRQNFATYYQSGTGLLPKPLRLQLQGICRRKFS